MISDHLLGAEHITWWIFGALQVALFIAFTRNAKGRSSSLLKTVVCIAGFYAAWRTIEYIHLDFIYDFTLKLLLGTIMLLIWKRLHVVESLYYSSIFLLCIEIGKIISVDICMQPLYNVLSTLPELLITGLWIVIVIAVAGLLLWLVSRWTFVPGIEKLSLKQYLLVLMPLIPYIVIRSSTYAYNNDDHALYIRLVALMLILSFWTIIMVVMNAKSLADQLTKIELVEMESILKERNKQYEAEKTALDAAYRQYHDLKHYVSALEAIRDTGQPSEEMTRNLDQLISEFRTSIEPTALSVKTGNIYLDIVLTHKKRECTQKGLRIAMYADGSRLGFMSGFDIASVFGNILDNAIEAAQQVESKDVRDIELSVIYQNDLAFIRCSNPFKGTIDADRDMPKTTKPDSGHGYGLPNITRIIQRYGGECSWHTSDNVFTLTACIPIPVD
ncbi:MAG: GHKL domain-containing protein [Coriobacteriales bacterium]|nr:GHKL domain-containing protein [Coriobacteriales bacterium]